jgi:hypothetical protein
MDAFSPPLERHLDNLAKTVKAVLKSPPLPGANVPAESETGSSMATPQISRPSSSAVPPSPQLKLPGKSIAVAIAILMIVAAAGWYLGHPHGKPQPKMSDMEWDTDRLGADYTFFSLPTDNPKQCEDACRSDEKCRSWTYVKPNTIRGPTPMCYLKSAIPPRQNNPSCVSGTKSQ